MENQARELGQGILQGTNRKHTKQFNFSEYDARFVGTFVYKHPSVLDRMQIGVNKAKMLQGLQGQTDVLTDNIAHMAATLGVVLTEYPEWFNLADVSEYEVLEQVYDEYTGWVNSFRKVTNSNDDAGDSKGAQ